MIPIPTGIDRGKIKFLDWCGTGNHFHTVYWRKDLQKFSTEHPEDQIDEVEN